MQVKAVVLDFDGTMAADQSGLDNAELVTLIRRLRKVGVKVIINTGRDLDYLIGPQGISKPEHIALFDAMIVECGAAVWFPNTLAPRPLTRLHSVEVVNEMRRVKIPSTEIWTGHCMVATRRIHAPKARRAIERVNQRRLAAGLTGIVLEETINNASATYLPPGVNKGTGLLQIVNDHFGIPPGNVLGGGDGANDLPFLSLCGAAIVPVNANPRVKALPNAILTKGANAAGLVEVLRVVLKNNLQLDAPRRGGCDVG